MDKDKEGRELAAVAELQSYGGGAAWVQGAWGGACSVFFSSAVRVLFSASSAPRASASCRDAGPERVCRRPCWES